MDEDTLPDVFVLDETPLPTPLFVETPLEELVEAEAPRPGESVVVPLETCPALYPAATPVSLEEISVSSLSVIAVRINRLDVSVDPILVVSSADIIWSLNALVSVDVIRVASAEVTVP